MGSRLLAAVALAVAFLVAAGSAEAAPPANDSFAAAAVITGASGTVTGTSVEATKEPGEPAHAGNGGGASVWYRWTSPVTGNVLFQTCQASFDTLLAVYTGPTVSSVALIASNDDACGNGSTAIANVAAGIDYHIAVDGFDGGNGTFTLQWSPLGQTPDNFADAQELAGESGSVTATNVQATKEPGEPAHAGNQGGHSVWYRWTAPFTGSMLLDMCGSGLDTLLAVYTGAIVAAVAQIAANDDDCGDQSRVIASVTAGTEYHIAVDGFDNATGVFTLRWSRLLPPANDDFAAALPLTGALGQVTGTNLGATRQAGEPEHGPAAAGRSVWFTWTPPLTGNAVIETCGSEFDTLLAVYTGAELASLRTVVRNDDRCGVGSRLIFPVRAGTALRIAVEGSQAGGEGRSRGALTLTWGVARPPANDRFAGARRVSGGGGSLRGTNFGASREAREPAHAGNSGGASLWFRWRGPRTMRVTFNTCDPSFDTVLAVYRGSRLTRLRRVAADDDDCPEDVGSLVAFRARRGTLYRIAVDGFNGAIGSFRLRWARVRG